MEHVVFYPYQGGSAFKRVGSLDEAVSFVEHLRNSENITEFNVHSLTPVPVSFRAYYHVEVPTDAAPAPEVPVAASVAPDSTFGAPPLAAPVEVPDAPAAELEPVAEPFMPEPVAPEAAAAPEPLDVPEVAEVPDLPEGVAADEETLAPIEATDEPVEETAVDSGAVEASAVEASADEATTDDAAEEPFDESFESAGEEDRSEAWVAEAPVVEAPLPTPALAPLEAPIPTGPFASAPPVTPKDSDDVVPTLPTGKRTMGFFAR